MGWPFIGETLEYLSLGKIGLLEKFISERKNRYSSNVFKTSYLGEKMVFLCTTEGNKFLFSSETNLLKTWFPSNFEKLFPNSSKTDMVKEVNRVHRIAVNLTKPKVLQEYVKIMDRTAKEQLKMYWDQKDQVYAYSLAKKYTFALTCKLLFNIQEPEMLTQLEELYSRVGSGLVALPMNIPGTKFSSAIRASKKLRIKIGALIKKRMSEVPDLEEKNLEPQDVLSQLMTEKYEDGEDINVHDLTNKVSGLIVAAFQSSSTIMVAIIKCLAEFPQVYERVRQEQMEIAKSKGPGEDLNYEDIIKKMSYSWNVIREVLRLHPPGSGGFREVMDNFSYEGFLIPKGWKLHWTAYATHKNPEYFPNPEEFNPSRFEENIVPFSFVPFGGGRHTCPGREFARLQLLVFMHNLVNKFRWEKVFPDEPVIMDPLLVPAKGLPIHLYPH